TVSNGECLFPLYWQEVDASFAWKEALNWGNWPFVSGVGITSDGMYFTRYGNLRADVSLWEPNAVEAEPGHIILYMRSCRGYLYRSESFDYGRTWSDAGITDIPNPDTKLTLIKIRERIFLINNFTAVPGFDKRTHLGITVSDDGIHFDHILDIDDPAKAFFYPHAFADDDRETLYIAYENARDHYLVKIPYSELGL
ncbi:MAG: exo-alpha-sialidase, partial [Clostridia bacterium]|nr:exo-alpha-sialidase [Clostridia bacterium]